MYSIFVERQYPVDPSEPIKRILDAGANVGYASVYFARHFPDAEIVSVEPEENNFQMLQRNTSAYPNIRCLKAALWKERTTLSMANPDADSWAFQLTDRPDRNGGNVNAYTVDDLLAERRWASVDLLKIDIEGAEREVFSADTSWLRNTRHLYIETHDEQQPGSARALFEALRGFDYQLRSCGDGLLVKILGMNQKSEATTAVHSANVA